MVLPTEPRPTRVPIDFTRLHQIDSSAVGDRYQVRVRLPEGYADTDASFPVLYLLDGDYMFAMATDIVQFLIYGGHVPDLIIASPAYGSKWTPGFGGTNMRIRDLLPFPIDRYPDSSAGAVRYLEFLERELIPFVEGTYRIDANRRVLAGYSLGAIFVVYAMFEKPRLFRGAVAIDGFDEQLWAFEEAFAARHEPLPVNLVMASRASDPGLAALAARLRERAYEGLRVHHAVLAGGEDDHFLVPAGALARSLEAAFAA